MQQLSTLNILRQGIYFMVLGPLIGLTISIVTTFGFWLIEINWLKMSSILSTLSLISVLITLLYGLVIFFYCIFIAYFIGAVPAFITGAISSIGKNRKQQIIYAVLSAGLIFSLLVLAFFNDGYNADPAKTVAKAVQAGFFGGFCAFICIFLRLKRATA